MTSPSGPLPLTPSPSSHVPCEGRGGTRRTGVIALSSLISVPPLPSHGTCDEGEGVRGRGLPPDIQWLKLYPGHAYLVGEPGGKWAVVDSGIPLRFEQIVKAAAERFGKDSGPEAIYLTHGHYDHAGSALALAAYWDVPIYIHRLEMPYVTGKAMYPPLDPAVGGPVGFAVRLVSFAPLARDLRPYVQPFPETGDLPGLKGWEIITTPGHTPGHVSFFRQSDRTLLAGDALMTVRLESFRDVFRRPAILTPPPTPSTSDWITARKSLRRLAALKPRTVAAGHGKPISGNDVATNMGILAEHFIPPFSGRYVAEPAIADENGVTYLPPITRDPLPRAAALIGVAAVIAGIYFWKRSKRD